MASNGEREPVKQVSNFKKLPPTSTSQKRTGAGDDNNRAVKAARGDQGKATNLQVKSRIQAREDHAAEFKLLRKFLNDARGRDIPRNKLLTTWLRQRKGQIVICA